MKFQVPKQVKEEAKQALFMHQSGYIGGNTEELKMAKQLAHGKYVTLITVEKLRKWFQQYNDSRVERGHERWLEDGEPLELIRSKKYDYEDAIKWLAHGGDSADEWLFFL